MKSARIRLRPWLESDAGALFKYASDPELGPRAGWPPHRSEAESLEVIRKFFLNDRTWAIELKETGEIIGCVGYHLAAMSNLPIGENQGEVGYWIARPFWNQGYCTEALRLVIDHCFREKGFSKLWGTFFTTNPASGRVMVKCGFKDTGEQTRCPNLEVGSDQPVKVMALEKNERIAFIDYIRVIACFLVMLVHASENFYAADASGLAGNVSMLANEANRFWVAFYDGFVGRTCVPLFMIVSAFLLVPLKPGQSMAQFYRRRFTRILPPMLAFMLIYTFLPLAWGGMTWEQSLADLKRLPFNFPSMGGHLWFMYPLIGLYLIIPVVSPWLEKASAREERIFLGLFALSTFIPWIHRFITDELWGECFWNGFTALWYCSGYLGYLVLAHYIHYHLDWSRKRKLIVGWSCFLAGAAFTGWAFWVKGVPGQLIDTPLLEWSWEFCTPNVLLATFGIFLVFTCIRTQKAPALVTTLSKCSFGMYLMHLLFLAPIAGWIVGGDPASPRLPVALAIPAIAVLTYICCAITTRLLSRIPGSKWVIG